MGWASIRYAAYIGVSLLIGMIVREYVRAFVTSKLGDPTPRLWGRLTWNPKVWFEVDEYSGPGVWRSAILQGDYEELAGDDAAHALGLLRARFSGGAARRPRETGREAVVFRIRVREATGRAVGR